MLLFISNFTALIIMVVQSFVFSWQVTLAGAALVIAMTLCIYYFGHLAQIRNSRANEFYETANVIFLVSNVHELTLSGIR